MKKLTLLVTSLIASVVLFTGCATNSQNQQVATAVIQIAAAQGTQFYITQHPTSRPSFETADALLLSVVNSTNLTFAQIQQQLNNINAGGSPIVALALSDALALINAYTAGNTNVYVWKPYVVALTQGIEAGLIATTPANTNNLKAVLLIRPKE